MEYIINIEISFFFKVAILCRWIRLGALERVSAQLRSLPGTWTMLKQGRLPRFKHGSNTVVNRSLYPQSKLVPVSLYINKVYRFVKMPLFVVPKEYQTIC